VPKPKIQMDIEEAKKVHKEFQFLALLSLTTLTVGTVVFRSIEGWDWIDSFYFSAVSLTTVGYGDITPATDEGKLFAVLYLFIGIGIIAAMINNLVKNQAAKRKIKEHNQENNESK
jgi:voltage-gated potassium channel Kch